MRNKKYIAFDIGGSKISAVLISNSEVITSEKIKTPQTKDGLYDALKSLADKIADKNNVSGYGICIGGAMNKSRDKMFRSPNLSFLDGVKIDKDFRNLFGDNTRIDNDTNCFLRGELMYGSAQDSDPVVGLTIGTGVGGAVYVNDQILDLAEIGQTVIDVEDGEYLTVEDLVSSHGFARFGIQDPKACEDQARDGDKKSIQIYDKVGTHLGTALGNMINIFNPELIILGGSIMNSGYLILEPAKKQIKNIAMFDEKYWPEIKISELDNPAELGVISKFVNK